MKRKYTSLLLACLMLSAQAWAELTQINGVYQIGTPQDLAEFAAKVTGGDVYVNAELTADIDYTSNYKQIGVQKHAGDGFRGTFNGNGHTVTVALTGTANQGVNAALFYNNRGTIENLRVQGTITSAYSNAGGICYHNYGIIRNCVAEVDFTLTIAGSATAGGISGQASGYSLIDNCLFKGSFDANGSTAKHVGAIYGWCDGTPLVRNCLAIASSNLGGDFMSVGRSSSDVYNCYYLQNGGTTAISANSGSTAVTAEDLASGKFAYTWGLTQNLDTETVPNYLGTSSKVYAVGSCDAASATSFTNDPNAATQHNFTALTCSTCGAAKMDRNYYKIEDRDDMVGFATLAATTPKACARLAADINMDGAGAAATRIGTTSKRYVGIFDGQGHTISNLKIDIAEVGVGLFITGPNVFLNNFFLDNTCTIKGQGQTGVIGSHDGEKGRFSKIGTAAKIVSTGENNGGLIGGCWAGSGTVNINACWTVGSIESSGTNQNRCGQLCGWTNNGTINFSNCWSTATMNHWEDYDHYWARYGATLKFTNCYSTGGRQVQGIVADDVKSGRLCFLLNGGNTEAPIWFQTLGEGGDAQPTLSNTSSTVYATYNTDCDGFTPTATPGYSNTPTGMTGLPTRGHNYVANVCTQCGQTKANSKNYTISTGDQLRHFAYAVEAGNRMINATLAADINLNNEEIPMIGSNGNFYSGTFDGQGHAIHNYSLTSNEDYAGFFGMIYQATVKDFSIDGNMTLGGTNAGGLIGQTNSSNTISDVHSTVNITYTGENGNMMGGIVGRILGSTSITRSSYGGTMTIPTSFTQSAGGIAGNGYNTYSINNCVFNGTVKATGTGTKTNFGGIIGYMNTTTLTGITNCLAAGNVVKDDGRTFNNLRGIVSQVYNTAQNAQMSKVTNCYYTDFGAEVSTATPDDTKATTAKAVTTEQLASGEVTYKLNGNQSEITWTQTIGTDNLPVLGTDRLQVYKPVTSGANSYYANSTSGFTLASMTLTDAEDYTATGDFTVGSLTYDRKLEAGGYHSLCLPFAIKESDLPTGSKLFTLSAVGQDAVTLTEVEEVVAGTPCFASVTSDFNFKTLTLESVPMKSGVTNGTIMGTFTEITGDDAKGVYKLSGDGTYFGLTDDSGTAVIKPFRSYIAAPAGVKTLNILLSDGTSLTPTLSEEKEAVIYDLAGRRVTKATKGIYIVNGKKVLK